MLWRVLYILQQLPWLLWKIFDAVVLFRMGTIYLCRFEVFPREYGEGKHGAIDDGEIAMWRVTQQEEWNRLSTSLALLGITNTVISQVTPDSDGASASLWLGAGGLSLCGLINVHLLSTLAFPLANIQVHHLMSNSRWQRRAIAMVIAGPTLVMFWVSALSVAGIVAHIWEARLNLATHRAFAFVPIAGGVAAVLVTFLFGNTTAPTMMYGERWGHHRRWRSERAPEWRPEQIPERIPERIPRGLWKEEV